ncbi:MAG: hypothetical protein OEL78_01990 [Hyphomicrobiales bacterium]|nr:hypothetical protein [Hyphomicrobiales bacterium]
MASSSDKPEKRGSLNRVGVVVLGMHRSGTSALTRVLSLLGCNLPQTLMPPNPNNEAGYWESDAIYPLNERILESAGTNWRDWLEFDPRRLNSPAFKVFREEASACLKVEFGDSPLFVLKDPRICRMVQFWTEILCEADVEPWFICILRNPSEVAASLAERDGIEVPYAHLLWLRHVLDAESCTRGRPRMFVSYDDLLTDWEKIADLARSTFGIAWPRAPGKAKAEIEEFLSKGYRHHSESHESFMGDGSLSLWLRGSYQILRQWTETGENSKDFAALDKIRSGFNTAAPAFAGLVTLGTKALEESRHLQQSLAETEKRLEAEKRQSEEELRHLQQSLAETEKRLEAEKRQSDQLRREVAERDVQIAEAKAEKAQIEDSLDERSLEITALSRSLLEKEDEADRMRQVAITELGRIITSLLDTECWPLLPKWARLKRQAKLLKRSGLFDAQWYLEQNKDVAEAKVDPAHHYIQYGVREGRKPKSAFLDTK